ncbi:hypothetical protein E2C01_023182 [Portunus trituberculatus]|uniref:Uncharacterized protein n=1 Tax=Portunus trituberculatus TaxID=210409 RepID=A0A5B7E928_PORTR|nr:hypothetical protein [Portunus trituberculatus]
MSLHKSMNVMTRPTGPSSVSVSHIFVSPAVSNRAQGAHCLDLQVQIAPSCIVLRSKEVGNQTKQWLVCMKIWREEEAHEEEQQAGIIEMDKQLTEITRARKGCGWLTGKATERREGRFIPFMTCSLPVGSPRTDIGQSSSFSRVWLAVVARPSDSIHVLNPHHVTTSGRGCPLPLWCAGEGGCQLTPYQ